MFFFSSSLSPCFFHCFEVLFRNFHSKSRGLHFRIIIFVVVARFLFLCRAAFLLLLFLSLFLIHMNTHESSQLLFFHIHFLFSSLWVLYAFLFLSFSSPLPSSFFFPLLSWDLYVLRRFYANTTHTLAFIQTHIHTGKHTLTHTAVTPIQTSFGFPMVFLRILFFGLEFPFLSGTRIGKTLSLSGSISFFFFSTTGVFSWLYLLFTSRFLFFLLFCSFHHFILCSIFCLCALVFVFSFLFFSSLLLCLPLLHFFFQHLQCLVVMLFFLSMFFCAFLTLTFGILVARVRFVLYFIFFFVSDNTKKKSPQPTRNKRIAPKNIHCWWGEGIVREKVR